MYADTERSGCHLQWIQLTLNRVAPSLSRNPNTRRIVPNVFYSPLGTETIVERMNGRASMQAIRRGPSPFYVYCINQPTQSNACRSTHSSPPPNITRKQTIFRAADETTAFQRRRASTSTSEATQPCFRLAPPLSNSRHPLTFNQPRFTLIQF